MTGMARSNLAAFAVLFRARGCGMVAAKFIQGRFGGLRGNGNGGGINADYTEHSRC
jgi:hypothetical protein